MKKCMKLDGTVLRLFADNIESRAELQAVLEELDSLGAVIDEIEQNGDTGAYIEIFDNATLFTALAKCAARGYKVRIKKPCKTEEED